MYAACMEKSARGLGQSILSAIITVILAVPYIFYLEGAVGSTVALHTDVHPQILTATHALPQFDFARLWYAGRIMLLRRLESFGWHVPVSPWFRSTFQLDILSVAQHPIAVWLYPPTMTLLGTFFSFVPLCQSFWLWNITTPVIAALCLRKSGLSWMVIVAGLGSPAGIYNCVLGQNGALTAAFFVAGLMCFETKPKFGGIMAGLLCIKPQIGVAFPLILLRQRNIKVLLWCFATAALVILLSLLVEGWQAWVWFITVAEPKTTLILDAPVGKIASGGFSVLMMARSFHATVVQAWAIQAVSSAVSAFLIWRRWNRVDDDPRGRMAFTVCLSLLLTPYGYCYDLVGFSIAMAAMFERSRVAQKPVYVLLWLMAGYYLLLWVSIGYNLMPAAAAFGAWLTWDSQPHLTMAKQSDLLHICNPAA